MLDVTRAWGLEFLFPMRDTALGRALREHGEFGRPEVELIIALARGSYVDVGANIGAIALPVASRRPELKVVGAEAHRGLAGLFFANTHRNHLSNVQPHHLAVGDRDGVADFPMPGLDKAMHYGMTSFVGQSDDPREPVRMTTLDALAPADVGFVKIDVEGFEPQVLAGAQATLNERRPAWLVEVAQEREDAARAVIATLRAAGYRLFWFYSTFSTPMRPKPKFHNDTVRGDLSVLALDGDPPWPMQEAGDAWPNHQSAFPYLSRFGFTIEPPPAG